jgi:diguanylate cyclase (GGDEF)-like protein/PAS domain S-box-containing protein
MHDRQPISEAGRMNPHPDADGPAVTEIDHRALLDALPDTVLVVDASMCLRYANPAGPDIFGWDPRERIGLPMADLVHPDDLPHVVSSMGTVQGKRSGTPVEIRVRTLDGSWRWVEFIRADAQSVEGVHGIIVVVRDITQRRMWEVAADDTEVFRHLVQHGSSIILLLDGAGRITSVNAAFTRLLGHDPSLTVGRLLTGFCATGEGDKLEAALARSRAGDSPLAVEVQMRQVTPDAPPRPIRFEVVNLLDDPVLAGFVVTGQDVSDLHLARQSLEHLARHDALTGLANRSVLLERLEQVVEQREPAAAVFIDLDRFKPVNDLLGHDAGDEVLRVVAARLTELVRPDDLVARVGGDEFVVLIAGLDDRAVAKNLCKRIDAALAEPYLLAVGPARVGASVGLAMTSGDSSVTGLLADADRAMYEVKAERRGEPLRRDPVSPRTASERRLLADELGTAMQRGEIVAHLQPVIALDGDEPVGVEALARWNHPRLGILGPRSFLSLAEDAGLDLLLGDVVLRHACEAVAALDRPLRLSVNLSVAQLADRDLRGRMAAIIAAAGLTPERVTVEVTEHEMLSRRAGPGRAAPERTLLELNEMGMSLVLDDFGTGYSSLTHVRRFPLAGIKIDRTFVAGAAEHAEDRAVIAAILGMAAALDLVVVAEGVERREQYDVLAELGCHFAQGYYLARPMPAGELQGWLSAWTGNPGTDRARRTRG